MATDELLSLYRQMLLIRRVEEESARAYVQGKIGGFLGGAFARSAVTTVLLAALMGGGCVLVSNGLEGIRPDSAGMLHDAVGALGPVLTGVVVYGLSARLARVRELDEILGALRRRRSGSQDGAE